MSFGIRIKVEYWILLLCSNLYQFWLILMVSSFLIFIVWSQSSTKLRIRRSSIVLRSIIHFQFTLHKVLSRTSTWDFEIESINATTKNFSKCLHDCMVFSIIHNLFGESWRSCNSEEQKRVAYLWFSRTIGWLKRLMFYSWKRRLSTVVSKI